MFGDKPFVEEDLDWALSLFEGVSPFLLSQILSLPMERWMAIEAGDPEDEGKQRGGVLGQWGKGGSAAMWSVLVEALIEHSTDCLHRERFDVSMLFTLLPCLLGFEYSHYGSQVFHFLLLMKTALYGN